MDKQRHKPLIRILERLPTPALIASPVSGKILWANKRLLGMYGTEDPAHVVGKSVLEFIQTPQLGRALADLAKIVIGQSPPPVTYQLIRLNGELAAGQVSSVPMTYDGQIAMLSFITDVSERERVLAQLRESDERYCRLLDAMPSGVVVVVSGYVAYANRALAHALGFESPDELLERSMYDFIDADYKRPIEEARQQMLRDGRSHPAAPVVMVRRDGSRFETTASSAVVRWDGELATQTLLHDVGFTVEQLEAAEEASSAVID